MATQATNFAVNGCYSFYLKAVETEENRLQKAEVAHNHNAQKHTDLDTARQNITLTSGRAGKQEEQTLRSMLITTQER